jgi:hypothetical protein
MTKEEDEENARKNEIIRACHHDPKNIEGKGIICIICGVQFATMMLARLAPVFPITDDD